MEDIDIENTNLIAKIKKFSLNNDDSIRQIIALYLLNNIQKLKDISINTMADECHCSKSSIVKFCKQLGLSGFKELLRILIWEASIYSVFKSNSVNESVNKKYFSNISENIKYLQDFHLNDFEVIANEIKKAKRSFLFGKGPNIHICEIFKNYLIKLNFNCFFSSDLDVQEKYVQNVEKDDICFIFTYSGLTTKIIDIWNKVNKTEASIVFLTANSGSNEFKNSKFKFLIKNNEEIFENQRSAIISFNVIVMQILNSLSKI